MNANRPTLLVVDDEPEVLRSLHDLFRRDYKVLTFERGADALKALETAEPPVIMSDQRMPEMTGVEFLRRAKCLRPDATRLLFTGYADIKAVIDAINEGNVFRYLTKPWDPDDLAAAVRQAVEHHDLIVERRRLIAELQESNARLVEADNLKRSFIEVASHELNTPVAVVQGMADLWMLTQAEAATPSERAWVERIQKAARRLARTVERMLKLLLADRFSDTLDARLVPLEPLVRRAIEDLGPFLEARRQAVELDLDRDLGEAEIDPAKVGDILTNLLVNAIKFTPDSGTIRVSAHPAGSDRVRFEVTDTGVGIAPEERRHLFKPFFTGYDTMHHSSGEFQFGKRGIGLGLCLVKSFVELHGGTVEVETAPDRGSTFVVELPRHLRAPALAETRELSDGMGL
jgi:signal transduction histidine kinase